VSGSEIDFKDAMIGGGFKIYNPNATATCSCGESFSV
jgi:iron-sulfur cluster assembly protein